MACRLPHSVEQMQMYVKKQCEEDDAARQNAIIDFIKQFDLVKAEKQRLREKYAICNDISPGRKAVIDKFFMDEARKDDDIADTLWGCVQQIQNNINTKINWSYQENKTDGVGASSSSARPRFVEQPLLDEEARKAEEQRLAYIEEFAGYRSPSYDSRSSTVAT